MRVGISSWAYAYPGEPDDVERWCRAATTAECNHLEIGGELVDRCSPDDAVRMRDQIVSHNLSTSVCGIFTPDRDLSSLNKESRSAGISYAKACIEFGSRLGARVVVGAFGGVGGDGTGSREDRMALLVDALGEVSAYGEGLGITCGLEALNRYENDLITTVADSAEVVEAVDSPNLGVHLDLFHAGIEESSIEQAIRDAGIHLVHLHAVSHRRRAPDDVDWYDWAAIARALLDVGYRGDAVMEIFRPGTEMGRLARVWQGSSDFDGSVRRGAEVLHRVATAMDAN